RAAVARDGWRRSCAKARPAETAGQCDRRHPVSGGLAGNQPSASSCSSREISVCRLGLAEAADRNVPVGSRVSERQRATRGSGRPCTKGLLAEAESLQQLVILGHVMPFDIIEELAATAGHLEEAPAAVEVLAMRAQVLGQVI